jgi:POT family proton-dependent oligopeptide transporter
VSVTPSVESSNPINAILPNSDLQDVGAHEASRRTIRDSRTFLGHPAGLFVLFLTEMWERFSYYGMRALLVLYMTKQLIVHAQTGGYVFGFGAVRSALEWSYGPLAIQPLASALYGLYTGLVYLTPFFGGMLADKVFGQRKTVVMGGILMAIGHFLMAMESMFLLALLFLILGNGCFKPNISTQVGNLYSADDPRRDGAFTIFYMGVNLGAFFSPLICGTLGQTYGWHYGFGAAGVGMVIGLLVYLFGQRFLAQEPPKPKKNTATNQTDQKITKKEWQAIGGLVALCTLNIVFWGVYEQQGNTMQLFADQNVDWQVFGWSMPTTWFQSMNPMFIFILAPVLNIYWCWQSNRKSEAGSIAKMTIGCFLLGASFVVLIFATHGIQATQKITFLWLVGCTLIYTLGELYLSPIGLSVVTKVAPARLVGMLMGMWFLSSFFGNILAGRIGMFYERMPKDAFFLILAVLGALAGLAIFALQRPIKKAIGHSV